VSLLGTALILVSRY